MIDMFSFDNVVFKIVNTYNLIYMEVKKINKCRVCSNENLISVVNLGSQYLTGVFHQMRKVKLLVAH